MHHHCKLLPTSSHWKQRFCLHKCPCMTWVEEIKYSICIHSEGPIPKAAWAMVSSSWGGWHWQLTSPENGACAVRVSGGCSHVCSISSMAFEGGSLERDLGIPVSDSISGKSQPGQWVLPPAPHPLWVSSQAEHVFVLCAFVLPSQRCAWCLFDH